MCFFFSVPNDLVKSFSLHVASTLSILKYLSITRFFILMVSYCRNILTVLDGLCSGRHGCNVKVSDLNEFRSACTRQLPGYLQAKYTCETGQWIYCSF